MGLTFGQRQVTRGVQRGGVNAANHARDYRRWGYRAASSLPLCRAKVMMRPNSSDKAARDSLRRALRKGVIMGKSIDLPDPLESASQPLGNADDLLAQLAGEEVDRLLAEADAEGTRQPKPGESRRKIGRAHV